MVTRRRKEKVVFTSKDGPRHSRAHKSCHPCAGSVGAHMAPCHDRSCTGHRDTHAAVVAQRICRQDSGRGEVGIPPSADHDVVGHSAPHGDHHSSRAAEESDDDSHRDAGCTHEAGRDDRNSSRPAAEGRDRGPESPASESDSAHADEECRFAA